MARATTGVTLLGAAVIHMMVVPEHLHEWKAAGVFFILLAGAELLGALVTASGDLMRSRLVLLGLVALTACTIALWTVSRTVGLPFGPMGGMPEPVGRLDIAATSMEAITLASLAWLALARARPARADLAWTAVLTP